MNDVLVLPTGPLVDASLALVRLTQSRAIADSARVGLVTGILSLLLRGAATSPIFA
jgi:hypothetical protein